MLLGWLVMYDAIKLLPPSIACTCMLQVTAVLKLLLEQKAPRLMQMQWHLCVVEQDQHSD